MPLKYVVLHSWNISSYIVDFGFADVKLIFCKTLIDITNTQKLHLKTTKPILKVRISLR